MLKIITDPQFTIDVDVALEGAEYGQTLRTTFRAIPEDEILDHDITTPDGFKAFLRRVVVKFHDLVDDADQPVAETSALRDQIFGFIHIRNALNRAYWQAQFKAKKGN